MIKELSIDENCILYEVLMYHEWYQENESVLKKPKNDTYNFSSMLSAVNPLRLMKVSMSNFDAKISTDLPWKFAVSHDGTLVGILQENVLEIRATRDGFTSVVRKISVGVDHFPQLRLIVWSPDSTVLAVSRENVVNLYNLLGNNLAAISQDGIENPLIGLTFLNTKFNSIKWSFELLMVSFNGSVRSVLYSAVDGVFEENMKFSLAPHYPKGVTCIVYHSEHNLLLVGGDHCCGKGRNGITAWRILNDSPYLKLAYGLENDEMGPSRWRSALRVFIKPPVDVVKKMKISPHGQTLACLHSNGSVSTWTLPGVKLIKLWTINEQPDCYEKLDDKNLMPVDIEWWSSRSVLIVRRNGAVTVCSTENLENLLGKAPEYLSGPPQVASIRAERDGAILLDCEIVVNHGNEIFDENAEIEDDAAASVLQETIQSALYMVTDIETFQPKKRATKHVQKTYRLVGLNEITSEILFHREIESGAYDVALALADKYNLDSDLVYQRQWQMSPITSETIENCLARIRRKDWIASECVRCVPDTFEAALKLLEFGLKVTKNASDSEGEATITAFFDGLILYEQILPTRDHYDKTEYGELRCLGALEAAVKYARDGRRDGLVAFLSLRTSLMIPHWLPILSNFPETLNPKQYRELLPKFVAGNCANWTKNWANCVGDKKMSARVNEDESVIYKNEPELRKFKTEVISVDLMYDWMKTRAYEIDAFSGSVENAFVLARLVIENGVPDPDRFLNRLRSLDQLVRCVDDTISLKYWDSLNYLDQATLLLKNTKPTTFITDVKEKLTPFVSCVNCEPASLIAELVCKFAIDGLDIPLTFLRYLRDGAKKEPIFRLDLVQKMRLALDCLYAYPRDDQLEQSFQIVECLPVRSENCDEREMKLHREVDELEARLVASETLNNLGCPKSLNYLKTIGKDAEKGEEIIRLAATAAVQRHSKTFPNLLNDLLDIQAALPLVNNLICFELYVQFCLLNADPVDLMPAVTYLTLSKDKPKSVSFERSVEIIIEAATAHFDACSNFERLDNNIAWGILSLIREPVLEIKELKGLIKAMGIIRNGVQITPLNVRRMANRWQLVEKFVQNSIMRIYEKELVTLAECLGLENNNRSQMEGHVYTIAANHAYEKHYFDYCIYLCGKIVSLDYAPAWDIMQKISKHREFFQSKTLDFLAFAMLHCPRDYLEDIIETRISYRKIQSAMI